VPRFLVPSATHLHLTPRLTNRPLIDLLAGRHRCVVASWSRGDRTARRTEADSQSARVRAPLPPTAVQAASQVSPPAGGRVCWPTRNRSIHRWARFPGAAFAKLEVGKSACDGIRHESRAGPTSNGRLEAACPARRDAPCARRSRYVAVLGREANEPSPGTPM